MDEKISIIVPVYKVEQYLDRCVDNLVKQTYENIEIILVDDGSPDNCPSLCDEWAKKDGRIKVIHKKNTGLGMARNNGLDVMTGDYVMFVDSDDYIDKRTCEIALKKALEHRADVCFYSCCNIYDESKRKARIPDNVTVDIYEDAQVINGFLVNSYAPCENSKYNSICIGISSCMAIYSASVIKDNNIRFFSERDYINEDLLFRIHLCAAAKKVIILPLALYFYCHHGNTLSTSYKENHFDEILKMYRKCNEEIAALNCDELYQRNKRYFMINLISCLKKEVMLQKSKKTLIKKLNRYCRNETVKTVLHEYPVSKMPITQKALFYAVKLKSPLLIILLIKLKFKTDKTQI